MVPRRSERCQLGFGRRATAKAIQVVVLARVKVNEGSGLRACEKEERDRAKERLLFYEPAPGSFYM